MFPGTPFSRPFTSQKESVLGKRVADFDLQVFLYVLSKLVSVRREETRGWETVTMIKEREDGTGGESRLRRKKWK